MLICSLQAYLESIADLSCRMEYITRPEIPNADDFPLPLQKMDAHLVVLFVRSLPSN